MACSTHQEFVEGKIDSHSSLKHPNEGQKFRNNSEKSEVFLEEDEDSEEDIVAIPPAIISGGHLVCHILSISTEEQAAKVACHFEEDNQKVSITGMDFDIQITDAEAFVLGFKHEILEDTLILNIELNASETLIIRISGKNDSEHHSEHEISLELPDYTQAPSPDSNSDIPEEPAEQLRLEEEQAPLEEQAPMEELAPMEEQASVADDPAADSEIIEISHADVLELGQSLPINIKTPACSPNGNYCLYFQRDRNLVVRDPADTENRIGASGTGMGGTLNQYLLVLENDQNLCIRTVDRDLSELDFCFGTANQFSEDPKLVLTDLGELKLIGSDPFEVFDIIIPGLFDPF